MRAVPSCCGKKRARPYTACYRHGSLRRYNKCRMADSRDEQEMSIELIHIDANTEPRADLQAFRLEYLTLAWMIMNCGGDRPAVERHDYSVFVFHRIFFFTAGVRRLRRRS